MKEEWDTSEGRMEIFSPSQRGMDLTTGNATNAKSMTQSSQSKICAHKATGLYNFTSLVVYFRDLSPEPALECEEELSPSPDLGASRPTSRATSTPPPTLTPHRPSSPSPTSSPGFPANQPKGADGPSQDWRPNRSHAVRPCNCVGYRWEATIGPPLRTRKLMCFDESLLLLATWDS